MPQCKDDLRICCNKPDYVPIQTAQKIKEDDFPTKNKTEIPDQTLTCGFRAETLGTRQKGNDDDILFEAEFGEFPWTMALFKTVSTDSGDLSYLCGAALISPKIAITVVHNINRIKNISTLVLRAGEFDMSSTKEHFEHQERTIQKVCCFLTYIFESLHYD